MNSRLMTSRLLALFPWSLCAVLVALAVVRSRPAVTVSNGDGALFDRPAHDKSDIEKYRADHPRIGATELEKEWEAAKQFLSVHSKNRYEQIERIPGGPKKPFEQFLVGRYRMINRLKAQSPELYNLKVREVELDDDVFGICLKLKRNTGDKARLQSELKARITELFDLGISERKLRIGLVETALADQKKILKTEQDGREQLVDDRYGAVLSEGVEGAWIGPKHNSPKPKSNSSTIPSLGDSEPNVPANP
ncbi:MAG TPA: hypothetical protein VG326_02480 [Tepidisphaeraceae bacterium]|jgi:hypothetical protein|nr:hypothetical protein [Tepidisphaeraceae bacterium]